MAPGKHQCRGGLAQTGPSRPLADRPLDEQHCPTPPPPPPFRDPGALCPPGPFPDPPPPPHFEDPGRYWPSGLLHPAPLLVRLPISGVEAFRLGLAPMPARGG